jgi:hypothetical protein
MNCYDASALSLTSGYRGGNSAKMKISSSQGCGYLRFAPSVFALQIGKREGMYGYHQEGRPNAYFFNLGGGDLLQDEVPGTTSCN